MNFSDNSLTGTLDSMSDTSFLPAPLSCSYSTGVDDDEGNFP